MATAAIGRRRAAVAFTGGKDSTLVLHLLRDPLQPSALPCSQALQEDLRQRLERVAPGLDVCMLVTFVPAGGAQPFKAHPLELIKAQAAALGLAHKVLEVETPFLDSYRANIAALKEHGIEVLATGDILDVCNSFMPRAAQGTGVQLICPLWGIDRTLLLEMLWHYQLKAVVTCVNTKLFGEPSTASISGDGTSGDVGPPAPLSPVTGPAPPAEAEACGPPMVAVAAAAGAVVHPPLPLGRTLDRQLVQDVLLPFAAACGVDTAGENGEYHTMCLAGGQFSQRVAVRFAEEPRQEREYRFLVIESLTLD